MKPSFALSRLAAATLLAACAPTAFAAVGARVLVQEWSPAQPDKHAVRILADDPEIVSRSIAQAWANARTLICAQIKARLGAPRLVRGQTLYDIDCKLDPNAAITVESAGANALRLTFAIRGSSIAATSTVPDPLGREFDPRFSLTLDATLRIALAVQADPNQTLRATQAQFKLGNAKIDSHNASGDVLKFVADDLIPFLGGPNFKTLAENAVNSVSFNLATQFNGALAPVNAKLRGPAGHVRVGVWGRPNRITVAFGPREIAPPANGSISGVVRWDPAKFRAAPNCASFALQASVQTGPGPLLDPDDYSRTGAAPMRNVGTVSMTPAGERECRFAISGVPAGWPNHIQARLHGAKPLASAGSAIYSTRLVLQPDGWSGPVIASAAGRDYVVAQEIRATAVEHQARRRNPLDPVTRAGASDRLNPNVRMLEQRSAPAANARAAETTQVQPGATVQLNPQPRTDAVGSALKSRTRPAAGTQAAPAVQPVR